VTAAVHEPLLEEEPLVTDGSVGVMPSPSTAAPPGGARAVGDAILRVLYTVTLAGVLGQFLLAGLAVFGAGFTAHVGLGRALAFFTVLPLLVMAVARPGWRDALIALAVCALIIGGQRYLARVGMDTSNAMFGVLHALNGFAIGALASQLLIRATRRQQLRKQHS
jgi:hypothetical protein